MGRRKNNIVDDSGSAPLYLRLADISDSDVLFELQTHPRTRKYFRNPEPPDRETHNAWLARVLASADSRLLIISIPDEPVGVLRLDATQKEGEFEISILVAPQYFGQGIGTSVLLLARKLWPSFIFVAEIMAGNDRSHKLFQNAGYVHDQGKYIQYPAHQRLLTVAMCSDGGQGIGFGHISRCLGLARAIEQKGMSPVFLVPHDSEVIKHISRHSFPVCVCPVSARAFWRACEDVDVMVIDSYRVDWGEIASLQETELLRNDRKRLLAAFDDFCVYSLPVDITINGAELRVIDGLGLNDKGNSRYLLGPAYQIIRSDLLEQPWGRAKNKSINLLVVMGGGGGCVDINIELLDFLCQYLPSMYEGEVQVDFVVGPLAEYPDMNLPANISLHWAPPNLVELMRRADIAVSAGGQTLLELVYCGVPTIALCLSENQEKNLTALHQGGYIHYVGRVNMDNDWQEELRTGLEYFLGSPEARKNLSERSASLIDGKGAKRIASELMSCLFQGKRTEETS